MGVFIFIFYIMAFNLLHFNCTSLNTHGQEFKHFLTTLDVLPDIICLQETCLKPNYSFTMPGFVIKRLDRDGKRGGLAFFIKQNIAYNEIVLPSFNTIECQCIQLSSHGKSFNLFNVYNPCNIIDIQDFNTLFSINSDGAIFCGDFNAHHVLWGSDHINKNGHTVSDLDRKSVV